MVTARDMEQFFLDYVRQKQIAEGDVPDSGDEEAGQCCAWWEKSVLGLEKDGDLWGFLLSHG